MSDIAFSKEDVVEPGTRRRGRQAGKAAKVYRFTCPKCRYTEYGGPSTIMRISPFGQKARFPRVCRQCGNNMMRFYDGKRETKCQRKLRILKERRLLQKATQ